MNPSQQVVSILRTRGPAATVVAAFVILLTVSSAVQSARAQTFTVLHAFTYNNREEGLFPAATLELDPQGNLYGTTTGGGPQCTFVNGCGAIFKVDTTGAYTVLHFFSYSDGAVPIARLLRDAAGNLYGTAQSGGDSNCQGPFGCGTVFKLEPNGQFHVLHTFTGGPDGANPTAAVIIDRLGNLYGTTQSGGDPICGCGNIFKLDTSGQVTVLHSFTGTPDGASPYSGLYRDGVGNFFGTTQGGGTAGRGTVFKLDATGNLTVLYNFTGGADGGEPRSSLIRDDLGNLYGTTYYGGTAGQGTVFKLNPSGKEIVLHSFGTAPVDGGLPIRGLARDAAGNFYGTTQWGGSGGYGTVFKLSADGKVFTVLYSVTGGADGGNPQAGIVLDAAGVLYGDTFSGYMPFEAMGVVFKITP